MFKFHFKSGNYGDGEETERKASATNCQFDSSRWLPAREHAVCRSTLCGDQLHAASGERRLACGTRLRLVSAESVLAGRLGVAPPELLVEACQGDTDLLSGRYEGGWRVWEGCWDLVELLAAGGGSGVAVAVAGRRVAELGCGAAVPGLWALAHGASSLLLQDYNPQVIDTITTAHLLLNTATVASSSSVSSSGSGGGDDCCARLACCSLYSGDWGALARLWRATRPRSVDLILSSETIYSVQSSGRLLDAIDALLADHGQCLIAAKTFYFGVGGGTRQFEQLVRERGGFCVRPLTATATGLLREVLLITRQEFDD